MREDRAQELIRWIYEELNSGNMTEYQLVRLSQVLPFINFTKKVSYSKSGTCLQKLIIKMKRIRTVGRAVCKGALIDNKLWSE